VCRGASAARRSCAARASARTAGGNWSGRRSRPRTCPKRRSRRPGPGADGNTVLTQDRETVIAVAERTCPRCGGARERDQRYCVDCGLALPPVDGRLPSLRRRWIRRVGWYPGDWIWVPLLTLVVAAAG